MHVEKLKEEADLAGARESEARTREQLDIETFSRRPTASDFQYCGLDEFQGRSYICRVKNRDRRCPDFAPRSAEANRSCATCANLVRPSERAFTEIERCVMQLAEGEELLKRIRMTLESRAPLEYQSCVQGAGILNLQPGFLAWCRAWSEEGTEGSPIRFVVGPVVNVGNDCDRWQRVTSGASPEDVELHRLVAQFEDQYRRARLAPGVHMQLDNETYRPRTDQYGGPMLTSPTDPAEMERKSTNFRWSGALEWAGRWAAIELIRYCMKLLGADPSFIASVADFIRINNPPHMDDMPDDQWIEWLRWQWNYGRQGNPHPGLRYLDNIAAWQQWLAQVNTEWDAAGERNRAALASNEQRAAERDQQQDAAEAGGERGAKPVAQPPAGGSRSRSRRAGRQPAPLTRSEQMMVEEMGLTPSELAMINKIRDPHQRGMQIMGMYMRHKQMLLDADTMFPPGPLEPDSE